MYEITDCEEANMYILLTFYVHNRGKRILINPVSDPVTSFALHYCLIRHSFIHITVGLLVLVRMLKSTQVVLSNRLSVCVCVCVCVCVWISYELPYAYYYFCWSFIYTLNQSLILRLKIHLGIAQVLAWQVRLGVIKGYNFVQK